MIVVRFWLSEEWEFSVLVDDWGVEKLIQLMKLIKEMQADKIIKLLKKNWAITSPLPLPGEGSGEGARVTITKKQS